MAARLIDTRFDYLGHHSMLLSLRMCRGGRFMLHRAAAIKACSRGLIFRLVLSGRDGKRVDPCVPLLLRRLLGQSASVQGAL
jgi:hypothetical protein